MIVWGVVWWEAGGLPLVSASITPLFSRYLRNSSFLESGVCGWAATAERSAGGGGGGGGGAQSEIGFLADGRRTNVAPPRARRGLEVG